MTDLSRLPGPTGQVWRWQRQGACRGRDTGQFFHPEGERGASRLRRELAAKALCRSCPVRSECAAHALRAREPYGVWGGFTETERLRLIALGWHRTNGDPTDGDRTDGDRTDGDRTDGDRTDGDRTDGDRTDGDRTDGDRTNGDRMEDGRLDIELLERRLRRWPVSPR